MGFGILQDPRYPNVPGTITLNEAVDVSKPQYQDYKELKKIRGIILVPQPTDSPKDPLKWSMTTKSTILVIISLSSGVTSSLGSMITTGFDEIASTFDVSTDVVSFDTVGVLTLTVGSGTFFTAAAAAVWGKRPVLIISTVALLGTNVWAFFASSFISLSISRAIQGLASSPLETLAGATISEISFVHERGQMLSIWNLFDLGGIKFGQLIASIIIQNLGFRYTFGICALIYTGLLLAIYFFVPETTFVPPKEAVKRFDFENSYLDLEDISDSKETVAQRLQVFKGRVSQARFWATAFKPIPLLTFPVVTFAAFTYAFYASDRVDNLPLFATIVFGTLISGYVSDSLVSTMTRYNKGVYEPEFRLPLMLVATVLSTASYVGLGFSMQASAPLYVPIILLCIQTFAIPFATNAVYMYVIDCHERLAPQAFVTMVFLKGSLQFGLSDFVNGWFQSVGAQSVFFTIAIVTLAISSASLPVYIFGKRLRIIVARSSYYQKF